MKFYVPTRFEEVLLNLNGLPWNFELFIPVSINVAEDWSLDMMCLVLDPDDNDDDDDPIPDKAKKYQLQHSLLIDDINSIYENLNIQTETTDISLLFSAIKFYVKHDSFMTV